MASIILAPFNADGNIVCLPRLISENNSMSGIAVRDYPVWNDEIKWVN